MPIVFGKPGTLHFRGRIRAQLLAAADTLASILAYDVKLGARVPPENFLLGADKATIIACRTALLTYYSQKN